MVNTKHRCKTWEHGDIELIYLRTGPKGHFQTVTKLEHTDPKYDWQDPNGEDNWRALAFCLKCFQEGKDPLQWVYSRTPDHATIPGQTKQ